MIFTPSHIGEHFPAFLFVISLVIDLYRRLRSFQNTAKIFCFLVLKHLLQLNKCVFSHGQSFRRRVSLLFCIQKADFLGSSSLEKSDFVFVCGMICLGALFRLIIQVALE